MPRGQERSRAKERTRWAARSATVGSWGPSRIQQQRRPSFRWDLVSSRRWSSNSNRTLIGSAIREAKAVEFLARFPSPPRQGREAHLHEFTSFRPPERETDGVGVSGSLTSVSVHARSRLDKMTGLGQKIRTG
ncbi:hypothetical protein MUK42_06909 [Musa troglodytarum]|uniref:Uncharacterized protein n=1 Tax=Musa troglodytarum TaxID=320322 RepID=A0A9E7KSW5_9LILI|nr:hypothetical protein MUK42_06909 [Musa troglodytarum]